jgi:hypothetical protein
MAFELGDRVVLKDGMPGRADHVGIVVRIDGEDMVAVHWSGSDAVGKSSQYARRVLELWEPEGD